LRAPRRFDSGQSLSLAPAGPSAAPMFAQASCLRRQDRCLKPLGHLLRIVAASAGALRAFRAHGIPKGAEGYRKAVLPACIAAASRRHSARGAREAE
jgi:hypothetical protein